MSVAFGVHAVCFGAASLRILLTIVGVRSIPQMLRPGAGELSFFCDALTSRTLTR